MQTETVKTLSAYAKGERERLLKSLELDANEPVETVTLLWDGDRLAGTGSRKGNILKCIALDEAYQGQDATATILTALRSDALEQGIEHLFLYTKPKYRYQFEQLFFYAIAQTESVLLMENRKDGIGNFLAGQKQELDFAPDEKQTVGAVIMNCNPFTYGHRYLIEEAKKRCDRLLVFVLSEEQTPFPAADRLRLVREGTGDLSGVTVLETGPYLVSSATFPKYFLKEKAQAEKVHCELDVRIFADYFVPTFGITQRFVGTEPLCRVTRQYNEQMQRLLPEKGVSVVEIPRKICGDEPISASKVRALLGTGAGEELKKLVPEATYQYLKDKNLI